MRYDSAGLQRRGGDWAEVYIQFGNGRPREISYGAPGLDIHLIARLERVGSLKSRSIFFMRYW